VPRSSSRNSQAGERLWRPDRNRKGGERRPEEAGLKELASHPGELRVEAVQEWATQQDCVVLPRLSWLQLQASKRARHSLALSATERSLERSLAKVHRRASGQSVRAGTADWESDGRRKWG
jgi:hypothetical protein